MRALEKLMRRHNRTLYRTARAILRDDAEAEDAVQEAWLKAYRSLGTFRGGSKLSTWLVRIAANEALMRRRRNARAPLAASDDDFDLISSAPGPEGEAQHGEARQALEARIDALPDDFRAVFVLRALEELNVAETAAALGIPEATVRTRFFRARALLRAALGTGAREAFAFAGMRCDRIVRRVMAAVILAVGVSACGEKPSRPAPEGEQAYNSQNGDAPLRERTLKQGESGRMSY
jgi:RNA polymerase sigma-70 factor (ECF subfamily)